MVHIDSLMSDGPVGFVATNWFFMVSYFFEILEQILTLSPAFSSFRVTSKEMLIPSRETLAHSSTLLLVRGLLPLDIA